MIELTEEYKAIAKEYRKVFGYGVPLSMIPPTAETEDLIRKIKDCIKDGKDSLLSHYGVEIKEGDLV
ncbi:MAG: hypothetical protein KHX40_07665 [Oscillospiraceae bacterium]|nr:hypothetical protein [Oscillospiraceae bacterium]